MTRRRPKLKVIINILYKEAQDFIKYANEWWEDYKTIRNTHSTRLIKLFLPTEDREN